MSQHSWYNPNRRHYGRKPNTRRARGLRRRDYGIKQGPKMVMSPSNLQPVEVETNVKKVAIPRSLGVVKRYAKMYNWYVQHYDKFPDKKICIQATSEKFGVSEVTVKKAIDVCKYILATTPAD